MTTRLKAALRTVALVMLAVTVVTVVLMFAQLGTNIDRLVTVIREDQKSGQQRSKDTAANTRQIKALAEDVASCTTPQGKCFRQGQDGVQVIVTYSAACAADVPTNLDRRTRALRIKACVDDLLDHNPPPPPKR